MFEQARTTLNTTVLNGTKMEHWVKLMQSYGAPAIDLFNPPWPDDYEERTDAGALFTRIENWLFKTHKIKLYSAEKSALSNALHAAITFPSGEVVGEVNNGFDWNPGDFGDGKSCFWGGKRQAWPILHKLGGHAFKVYKGGKGIARCLILPYDNKPVLFNAFGWPLYKMTDLYNCLYTDGPVVEQHVEMTVDGHNRIPIHFNEIGALLTEDAAYQAPEVVNWDATAYYNKRYARYHLYCEKCYNRVLVRAKSTSGGSKGNITLCEDCYGKIKNSGASRWHGAIMIHDLAQSELDDREDEAEPKRRSSIRDLVYGSTTTTTGNTYTYADTSYRPNNYFRGRAIADRPITVGDGAWRGARHPLLARGMSAGRAVALMQNILVRHSVNAYEDVNLASLATILLRQSGNTYQVTLARDEHREISRNYLNWGEALIALSLHLSSGGSAAKRYLRPFYDNLSPQSYVIASAWHTMMYTADSGSPYDAPDWDSHDRVLWMASRILEEYIVNTHGGYYLEALAGMTDEAILSATMSVIGGSRMLADELIMQSPTAPQEDDDDDDHDHDNDWEPEPELERGADA